MAYLLGWLKSTQVLTGLEWDGNETTNTQRVLRFLSPPAAFPMTYIFKVYPKGPKSGATNPAYWTMFFWGNYGTFASPQLFYGTHPYPFDGNTASTGQNWEVSADFRDLPPNEGTNPPGAEVSGGWNRWYTQVTRAYQNGANYHIDYIWDWDLFVSSSGTDGMHSYTFSASGWSQPITPCIVIGEAPPNDANTTSWGGYAGREQYKGIIRGIQIYNARLGAIGTGSADAWGGNHPTVANLADVASELATPGSITTPWYLNLNPTTSDVTDKSGSGHNPTFPASTPSNWSS